MSSLKIGVLLDQRLEAIPPYWDIKQDFLDGLRLTFDEATEKRLLDRPVELILREVEGLPRGAIKPVIDAYKELVEEGCLAVLGPMISENALPLAEYIDKHREVPAITWCGTDTCLGEYMFSLSNGSLPDEPHVLANIIGHAGFKRIGVLREEGLIGDEYAEFFRLAAEINHLSITADLKVPATANDPAAVAEDLARELAGWKDKVDTIVYLGYGFGVVVINQALSLLSWDLPRYTTSAWEVNFAYADIGKAYVGWVGLEQFDEENKVGRALLDRFEKRFGRRPEYFVPIYAYDLANALAHGLALTKPMSPSGVRLGLEKVRMLPAACGAPDTRISYGKYSHRGWVGAGYMVARELDPKNPAKTIFRGRIGEPVL